MSVKDPYARLRPPLPTPIDEQCGCSGDPPIMLRSVLASNPVACVECNLEVPPERLGFTSELAAALAGWRAFHDCFFILWLDSQEFESWAQAQLETPDSPVNRRGLALASELNAYRKCYYWWFARENFSTPEICRVCSGHLERASYGVTCENCQILYCEES